MRDGYEVRTSRTNPRKRDTDRDGLRDRYEIRTSRTNPRRADTDGDGLSDGMEVRLGLDPLKPNFGRSKALPPAGACTRTATSASTLASEFGAARAGETICLAAGSYGTFLARDVSKSGVVTIRSQTGQDASLEIEFIDAANIRLDSVTVTGAVIRASSRNITVSNSRFTGIAVIQAGALANANILFDSNTHINIAGCSPCYAGRVHVDTEGDNPTGVTVRNSLFEGGTSDGVRADANDVQIIGNTFRNMKDQDPYHTDPIQIYGGLRTVIRANLFVGGGGGPNGVVAAAIMAPDGNAGNIIENNVITPGPYYDAIQLGSDSGSIIRHNTFIDGTCMAYRCGNVSVDAKPGDPESRGTIVRDNILSTLSLGRATGVTSDHNLYTAQNPVGTGDLRGVPTYFGGLNPTTFAAALLAPGSIGVNAASDGTNVGITP